MVVLILEVIKEILIFLNGKKEVFPLIIAIINITLIIMKNKNNNKKSNKKSNNSNKKRSNKRKKKRKLKR